MADEEREQRRAFRSIAWKLLRAGFVTLSYDQDGQDRFTWNPKANFTAEEDEAVCQTIGVAGPQGNPSF